MARLCLLLSVLALVTMACSGSSSAVPDPEKPGDGGDDPPPPPPAVKKVLHVGLEYIVVDDSADPVTSRVSIIFTDETGATSRDITGEFAGGCSNVTAAARAEELKPLLGLDCTTGEAGVHLRYVHRRDKLYVVIANVEAGDAPSYRPLKEIDLPQGVPLKTD